MTKKLVSFENNPPKTFSYPRVEAADIHNVYYQQEEYMTFRRVKLMESIRENTEATPRKPTDLNQKSMPCRRFNNSLGISPKVPHRPGVALTA